MIWVGPDGDVPDLGAVTHGAEIDAERVRRIRPDAMRFVREG